MSPPVDVICEIETDKATMEVEAVDEGSIGKILVAEGTEGVAVNSVIAVLLEEGEDASEISAASPSPQPSPQKSEGVIETANQPSSTSPLGGEVGAPAPGEGGNPTEYSPCIHPLRRPRFTRRCGNGRNDSTSGLKRSHGRRNAR